MLATFHYGSARAIGGGEYERTPPGEELAQQRIVAAGDPLQPELDAIAGGGRLLIGDSLVYTQTPTFKVNGVTAPGAPGSRSSSPPATARPLIAAGGEMTLAIGEPAAWCSTGW